MSNMKRGAHLLLAIVFFSALASCGGGGVGVGDVSVSGGDTSGGGTSGGGTSAAIATVLNWNPPATYTDQTTLDPASDLSQYEIYVNNTGVFSDMDEPSAVVSAINSSGNAVTSFDMLDLPFTLSPDVTYYVSMKSVSSTGLSSDFSPAFSFML